MRKKNKQILTPRYCIYCGAEFQGRMDKKFCQNLKAARAQSGMTQKQIATLLGVVESCYANWEQGRTEPSVTMLRALCNTLNVTADELLNGEL